MVSMNMVITSSSCHRMLPPLLADYYTYLLTYCKKTRCQPHCDFHVQRSVVYCALQRLLITFMVNNVCIDMDTLAQIPMNENLSQLTVESVNTDTDNPATTTSANDDPTLTTVPTTTTENPFAENNDLYHAHLISHYCYPVHDRARGSMGITSTTSIKRIFICYHDVTFHWRNANNWVHNWGPHTLPCWSRWLHRTTLISKHPCFSFFALNTETQWNARQTGSIYVKQHPGVVTLRHGGKTRRTIFQLWAALHFQFTWHQAVLVPTMFSTTFHGSYARTAHHLPH